MAWLGTWRYRCKITIDATKVDANLSWFPVLVKISASCGQDNDDMSCIFDEVGTNSHKIAFTHDDKVTQLYAEIEDWDLCNEIAWIWVSREDWDIDNLANTEFYLYFDNAQPDNDTFISDIRDFDSIANPVGEHVWNDDYTMVLHMKYHAPPREFTRDAGNPIYFHAPDALSPYISKLGAVYHMFYIVGVGGIRTVNHATCATIDGTFVADPNNPVLQMSGGGEWDNTEGIFSASILKDIRTGEAIIEDGKYWMYYSARGAAGGFKIGLATMPEANLLMGANWTKDLVNSPCLSPSVAGWDSVNVGRLGGVITVKRGTNDFLMLYAGYETNLQIGLATSTDLLTWVKEATNPIVPRGGVGDWDEHKAGYPDCWLDGSLYIVTYCGIPTALADERLGIATGTSLITDLNKSAHNPIAVDQGGWESGGISDFSLWREPCTSATPYDYIFYEGENGFYAIGRMWLEDIVNAANGANHAGTAFDSTSYHNDAIGHITPRPIPVGGQISKCIELHYGGATDWLEVARDSSIEPQNITMEAWFNADIYHNGALYDKHCTRHVDPFWRYAGFIRDPPDNDFGSYYVPAAWGGANAIYTVAQYIPQTWTHFVSSFDGLTNKIHINGAAPETNVQAVVITYHDTPLNLGRYSPYGNGGYYFDGYFDEFRFSKMARSNAWVKATYESGRDNLLSFGAEEIAPSVVSGASIVPILQGIGVL